MVPVTPDARDDTPPAAGPALAELPEPLRARVVALSADVLPAVVRLPPSLRRVPTSRRPAGPGSGAARSSTVLGTDDEFRERVGTQVAARPAGDADDPVELAARAWLTRPEGWGERSPTAYAGLAERAEAPAADETEPPAGPARGRRAGGARPQGAPAGPDRGVQGRERRAAPQARGVPGRRAGRPGGAGGAERRGRRGAHPGRGARGRPGQGAPSATRPGRPGEAEAAAAPADTRSERDEATVRARVLLDTVMEAARGCAASSALAGRRAATRPTGWRRSSPTTRGATPREPAPRPVTPALLEQLLAMPRARLLVDGYNVSKAEWPTLLARGPADPAAQRAGPARRPHRGRHHGGLRRRRLDRAARGRPPPAASRCCSARSGVIADDVMRELVAAEPPGGCWSWSPTTGPSPRTSCGPAPAACRRPRCARSWP